MKRTPKEIYDYESVRIDKYKEEFYEIIETLDNVDLLTTEKLVSLFEWYGNARAIKSKAYQELKQIK